MGQRIEEIGEFQVFEEDLREFKRIDVSSLENATLWGNVHEEERFEKDFLIEVKEEKTYICVDIEKIASVKIDGRSVEDKESPGGRTVKCTVFYGEIGVWEQELQVLYQGKREIW